ncbi:MAG: sulfotransferase, partial [Cyanobacteria bacterium P01_F01_bin.143]
LYIIQDQEKLSWFVSHNYRRIKVMSFFIIGTQNSGSNFLRFMLNKIEEVATPNPPHILQRMMPLIPTYGDLQQLDSFKTLVDDVCRLVELNNIPWQSVKLERDEVISRCQENSLVAVFAAVYDIIAETWGVQKWCCQSLDNIFYAPEITKYLDNAKFIYLCRDGRDVALSRQKAVSGRKHIYNFAQEWVQEQHLALKLQENLREDRFYSISYEEITSNPQQILQDLCDFMEVESEATVSNSLFDDFTQLISLQNTQKFLKYSSNEELRIFESVAGDILDVLGYERVSIAPGQEIEFSPVDIHQFNRINREKLSSYRYARGNSNNSSKLGRRIDD